MRLFILTLLMMVGPSSIFAQKADDPGTSPLRRRAQLGVRLQMETEIPQAVVSAVTPGSPAERAGLRAGDHILKINRQSIADAYVLQALLQKIRGGDRVQFTVLRSADPPIEINFSPVAATVEIHPDLSLETVQVTNDYGDRLRAFVTKPPKSTGRLPAILFVSWLSCSTVEDRGPDDSWSRMMHDVASKSGALMLRLEKPGVGDSEGPPCSSCDLTRELNGYQAALRYLKSRTDVDTTRLVIFGGSLGGTLSAAVGRGHSIKAYVTAVSVYKTWLEHMIEIERRRLLLTGKTYAETSEQMPGYIEFYHDYLVRGKTPAQVIQDRPQLKSLWYDDPAHQYGRPAVFYQQVQQMNFMENWLRVTAPVLVVAGTNDWIMTLDDNRMLVDAMNARTPGAATLLLGEGMDHHWMKYNDLVSAFEEKGGVYDEVTVSRMVEWIKERIKE